MTDSRRQIAAAKSFEICNALAYNVRDLFNDWHHSRLVAYCCHKTDKVVAKMIGVGGAARATFIDFEDNS